MRTQDPWSVCFQNDEIRAEFLLMLESQLKAAKCFKDSFPEALLEHIKFAIFEMYKNVLSFSTKI